MASFGATSSTYAPSYTPSYSPSFGSSYGGTSTIAPRPSTPVLPVPSPGNTTPVLRAPGSTTTTTRLSSAGRPATGIFGTSPKPATTRLPNEAQPIYVPPSSYAPTTGGTYRPPPTPSAPSMQPTPQQQATSDYERQFKSALSNMQATQSKNAAETRAWLEAQAKRESESLSAETQAIVNAPQVGGQAPPMPQEDRDIGAGWMADTLRATGSLSEGIGRRRMSQLMQPPLSGKVY